MQSEMGLSFQQLNRVQDKTGKGGDGGMSLPGAEQ